MPSATTSRSFRVRRPASRSWRWIATCSGRRTTRASSGSLRSSIHTKEDFAWPRVELRGAEVVDLFGKTPDALLAISPKCNRWPVGAMDLRHHNDAFFRPFLQELLKADLAGSPHATKCGQMDFRWIPKARLARGHFDDAGQVWTYRITNPDECAVAANAQSAEDYAAMVAASGYLELMQLSVLFRHEATEPDRSQTVRFDDPVLYADAMPSAATDVKSENIFMKGTISSSANREPRKILAHVRARTQPIKRARPFSYQ